MQNFLPCKTPTRGGHLDPNGLPRSGQLAATYEDPDAHMGHSPLVLGHPQFQHRNHHNLEVSVTRQRPVPLFTPTPPLLIPHTSLCPGVSGFELPGSPLSSEFAHCYDTTAPFQLSCTNPGIKEGCEGCVDMCLEFPMEKNGKKSGPLFIQIELRGKNGGSRASLSKY